MITLPFPARPCGACNELVPLATGCQHWKPGRRPVNTQTRRQRAAELAARVAEVERVMGRKYK